MFTGIIQDIGTIVHAEPLQAELLQANSDAGLRLTLHAPKLSLSDVALGDSIALNGACMTVTSLHDKNFTVDISRESLNKTVGLNQLGEVNLEKAMRIGEHIGGHLVSGHVDGIGHVSQFFSVGESWQLEIAVPLELARYMAYKGSVVVNGVSLTVNKVVDDDAVSNISINLIPHTIAHTTLKNLQVGSAVNLEIDLIARYVERILTAPKG